MNINIKILVLWVAVFALASCGKEDTTPPEWEFIFFDPQPLPGMVCGQMEQEVFYVTGGDTLSFTVFFSDDTELSQYKIDIHENFDCHGHGKTSDWSVLEVINLSGTEQTITKNLVVPENITAGKYHFIIQLLDAAGNQSQNTFIRDIAVTNPTDTVAPAVTVTSPLTTDNISISRGGSIIFQGSVSDNLSLGTGGNGKLAIDFANNNNGNKFNGVTISFPESQGTSYTFNETITIPNSVPAGSYTFRVYAYDGVNNLSEAVLFNVSVN